MKKNNFSEFTKTDTSGGFELRARLAHHQTHYRLRYAAGKAQQQGLPISAGGEKKSPKSPRRLSCSTTFKGGLKSLFLIL